jgi:hypothetical protein
MRIFLAGATGAIGKRLVPQLIVHGHQVIATTRSAAKVDALRALGAEPVVVDGLDAVAVGEAVARAEPEAIIHQMTALAGTPDMKLFDRWFATTNQLRTRGTEHLLAAAQAARSRLRRARARRRPGGRSRSGRRRSGRRALRAHRQQPPTGTQGRRDRPIASPFRACHPTSSPRHERAPAAASRHRLTVRLRARIESGGPTRPRRRIFARPRQS